MCSRFELLILGWCNTRQGNTVAKNKIILFSNIILFVLLLQTLPLEKNVTIGLSILIFIGVLWLTEAIHITVTALLVPILAVIFHVYDAKAALSHFSNPVIYQFLGGFALAAALRKQEIDKVIAGKILKIAKGKMAYAVLMLFVLTAGLCKRRINHMVFI
jgi:solute carrier family 13 (sodium-dependent dicarboxylate transporter), member 2/3/5